MNLLKKIVFVLLVTLSPNIQSQEKEERVIFYKDTSIQREGFTMTVKKAFSKKLWLKAVISVNNPTDKFIIFNTSDVFLRTGNEPPVSEDSRNLIVVPPKYILTFGLRYLGKHHGNQNIAFEFTKIQVTDRVNTTYQPDTISTQPPKLWKNDSLRIAVHEVEASGRQYVVKTKVYYSGHSFLGVQFYNIKLNTSTSTYLNSAKKRGKFHYTPGKEHETFVFTFPTDHYIVRKDKPRLVLNDVFKEYSLKSIDNFTIELREGPEPKDSSDKNEIEEMD